MSMEEAVRILGIDPGTRHVGYGVVERCGNTLVWVASGCIVASADNIPERLVVIHRGLSEVIRRHSPRMAAVETVFTSNNPKTAIAIGEGRGVAVLSAAEQGLEVKGYEPALVKRAVAGSGRADKEQVRSMVRVLLALPHPPETDHESDALALAITHARHICSPVAVTGGKAARVVREARRCLPEHVLRQLPPDMLSGIGRMGRR